MTIGSVKHSNVLPQPASASSARVTSPYDYNGASAGGVGGSIGGGGSGVGGGVRSVASGIGGGGAGAGGRIRPHSPSSTASSSASSVGMMRSTAKRCLFDRRPDPLETKRICDEHAKAERLRFMNRYEVFSATGHGLTTSSSSASSASVGLHSRYHHQ